MYTLDYNYNPCVCVLPRYCYFCRYRTKFTFFLLYLINYMI